MNHYENESVAQQFLDFLQSKNGRLQQQVLLKNIQTKLSSNKDLVILDAACGNGWLSGALSGQYKNIQGFDSSPALINTAKQNFPEIIFTIAKAEEALPYSPRQFDCVILSMASHDLEDQAKAFCNFYDLLKPGGQFLITLANPYYSYPVGVWKRGWWRALLHKKPLLKLRPYNPLSKQTQRTFKWKQELTSRFYPLSESLNNILKSGVTLASYQDLQEDTDSSDFDLTYQLHRFPLILLLEFKKPAE